MTKKWYENFKITGFLANPHVQTIAPHLLRKVTKPNYVRQRFNLSDGDFIDLDWVKNKQKKLCIILPGLESNANRHYIYGVIQNLKDLGYDFVVLNYRSCSGQENNLFQAYHGGFTNDLKEVLTTFENNYKQIDIIGFCLGGNITLKYAGEGNLIPKNVTHFIGISVPCDLESCALSLKAKKNKIYENRFLKSLKKKITHKSKRFPNRIHPEKIKNLSSIYEFDDYFTAPSFGYSNAKQYYNENSSLQFLKNIRHPTLLICAQDDPFLSANVTPFNEIKQNNNITFLNPKNGGHLGFMKNPWQKIYWHETQIIRFLKKNEPPA